MHHVAKLRVAQRAEQLDLPRHRRVLPAAPAARLLLLALLPAPVEGPSAAEMYPFCSTPRTARRRSRGGRCASPRPSRTPVHGNGEAGSVRCSVACDAKGPPTRPPHASPHASRSDTPGCGAIRSRARRACRSSRAARATSASPGTACCTSPTSARSARRRRPCGTTARGSAGSSTGCTGRRCPSRRRRSGSRRACVCVDRRRECVWGVTCGRWAWDRERSAACQSVKLRAKVKASK